MVDTLNTQGEPGRAAVNYVYLLRYLAGKQGIITLSQFDKTGPLMFEYQNLPRVLIMPMAVQWGDEPAAAEEPEPVSDIVESPEVEEPESSLEEPEPGEETTDPEEPVAVAVTAPAKPRRKKTAS